MQKKKVGTGTRLLEITGGVLLVGLGAVLYVLSRFGQVRDLSSDAHKPLPKPKPEPEPEPEPEVYRCGYCRGDIYVGKTSNGSRYFFCHNMGMAISKGGVERKNSAGSWVRVQEKP